MGDKRKWSLVALKWWSSYTLMVICEFTWAETALAILDKWLSYRGGCLNMFDCNALS